MHSMITSLAADRNELEQKLMKAEQEIARMKVSVQHLDKERAKVEIYGIDELEQLRASIKSLEDTRDAKVAQCEKLKEQVGYLHS